MPKFLGDGGGDEVDIWWTIGVKLVVIFDYIFVQTTSALYHR